MQYPCCSNVFSQQHGEKSDFILHMHSPITDRNKQQVKIYSTLYSLTVFIAQTKAEKVGVNDINFQTNFISFSHRTVWAEENA